MQSDRISNTIRALEAMEMNVSMELPVGQVIVYPQHKPGGVYVGLTGAIRLIPDDPDDRDMTIELTADEHPFVFPTLEMLDVAATCCASVSKTSRLIYIPRSVVISDEHTRALLTDLARYHS
ncbi:MAG: hypothetical protein H6684_01285 [Deltaproteobacteria bacterium]|nr:hypothetical protein [bacterium]MCB9487344.1 hypothetical protein [Deltaproteobacteria bacterium]